MPSEMKKKNSCLSERDFQRPLAGYEFSLAPALSGLNSSLIIDSGTATLSNGNISMELSHS